jgi:hypothetical protein
MGYNTSIPQGTNPILQSQKQIFSNYQQISQIFAANHFPLPGDQDYLGQHVVLTMRPQMADPTTSSTQIALYNKLDVNSIPELFFRPNNSQTAIQLTYPSINTSSSSQNQYSFVAGPFIFYAGKITNPTPAEQITLSPTSNILYVGITTANFVLGNTIVEANVVVTSINSPASTFTLQFPSPGTTKRDIYYIAIGQ